MSGTITGETEIIDRYPYGEAVKTRPVADATVKAHIQADLNPDANLITDQGGYIDAAVAEVENRGVVALINQKRRLYIGYELIGCLAEQLVSLPYGPIQSILAVKYLDIEFNEQTLDAAKYRKVASNIYFKNEVDCADMPGAVWVEYECGFGTTPSAVPAPWQTLVCQLAMRRYERREGAAGSGDAEWERMIDRQIICAGGNRRGV